MSVNEGGTITRGATWKKAKIRFHSASWKFNCYRMPGWISLNSRMPVESRNENNRRGVSWRGVNKTEITRLPRICPIIASHREGKLKKKRRKKREMGKKHGYFDCETDCLSRVQPAYLSLFRSMPAENTRESEHNYATSGRWLLEKLWLYTAR